MANVKGGRGRRVSVFIGLCAFFCACSAAFAADDLFRMTFPDFDSLGRVSISRMRVSGKVTKPGTRVFVDGREEAVYESGAFIAMLELEEGENSFEVRAVNGGEEQTRILGVSRSPAMASSPAAPLAIEKFIAPSSDCMLMPADSLRVTVKGTPDCEASFRVASADGWREMTESELYSGVAGVYSGLLKIPEGMDAGDGSLSCRLRNDKGEEVSAESPARVSILPAETYMVGSTRPGARVRTSFNGTFLALLPEDIDLAITGKRGGRFRVAFCDGQSGWVDEDDIRLLPSGAEPASSLVRKINYSGQPEGGIFSIPLDGRVPYDLFYSVAESRIVLRLFNCFSKLNWIDIPTDDALVSGVEWRQDGDICEVSFNLAAPLRGYSARFRGRRLDLALLARRAEGPYKVVLDPGHGGMDSGAIGPAGTMEKDAVLDICLRLAEKLRARGFKVVLTRSDDRYLSLAGRTEIAHKAEGDLFLSVHMNAVGMSVNPLRSGGYHVFFTQPFSLEAARRVHAAMPALGLADNGIVCADFHVTRQTFMPAVLVETCFLTNPLEEVTVLNGGLCDRAADALADGVAACFADGGR